MKNTTLCLLLSFFSVALQAQFNPTNCTSWVINPSFETGIDDGWTNNGFKPQNNNEALAGKTGNYYAERWVEAPAKLPNLSLQQKITGLRNGTYEVSATCHAEMQGSSETVTGVWLVAGAERVAISQTKRYTIPVTVTNGTLTIGYTVENTTANWVTVDHFQIVKTDGGLRTEAKPLNRGLMAVNLSQSNGKGNLVSWRIREKDPAEYRFRLYRGTNKTTQATLISGNRAIQGKSNFLDVDGTASSYYRLEVLDASGNVVEEMSGVKPWANQTMTIPTITPTDARGYNAVYTPNDASFCDMDGDGEYEIILKWDPSNAKDAASDGTTSDTYFDCYKMDGTRLWRINQGPNIRSGAHTTPFIAWDLNGDGYGEFVLKTAPGTIDGNGNYVVMKGDDPLQNCLSGRGKPDKGPEYLTVFDGMTGAEISTIPYHTKYGDVSTDIWGDSKQNRSERYTACLAYLDGEDRNPSAIFNRGYYAGAFVGAYDFDGTTLKERWVSRNTSSGKGLWGEGAHWLTAADLDGDGKHEIQFGSAALDHNGALLYRTGLKHGDAFHIGDFITTRPGLEVFMCHESSPYGADLRDAKTGEILQHPTASSDTGRGLAAHFDSSQPSAQFMHSATAQLLNCEDGSVNANSWAIGSSGAGINARIYWTGDLYDEFFDKSIIAHWNPTGKGFDRIQVNGGNYVWGSLCNGTKNNPCVLGDLLGDWREEIVTYDAGTHALIINATNFESPYPVPHLMDNIQYRENVVSQNVGYNQPPHLSYDPSVRFKELPKIYTGDLDDGTYYIRNYSTKTFLAAGSTWGTKAILSENALDFDVRLVDDDTYIFDSKISNGGDNHYLTIDEEPYLDGAAGKMKLTLRTSSYGIHNGSKYLKADGGLPIFNAASIVSASRWQFLTRDAMITDMKKAKSTAPTNATFLIQDPNFGRNDLRYSAWKWSAGTANAKNGGEATNFCVECWHSTFTFSQQLQDIPDGWYELSAQGFYRADGGGTSHAELFAEEESIPLPDASEDGGETADADAGLTTLYNGTYIPNTMDEASKAFSSGRFKMTPLLFHVTEGKATIGVRNELNTEDWCIWDNFTLKYYGETAPDCISLPTEDTDSRQEIYTINGVRTTNIHTPGIYIVNGKKMIVR